MSAGDDDVPELTPETARELRPLSDLLVERGLKPPGRPRAARPKVAVSLRLDAEVLEAFKAGGPGWQTRMNEVLAASLKRSGGTR